MSMHRMNGSICTISDVDSKLCWLKFLTSADHVAVRVLRCKSSQSVDNCDLSNTTVFLGNGEESSVEENSIDFLVDLPGELQVNQVAKSDQKFAVRVIR